MRKLYLTALVGALVLVAAPAALATTSPTLTVVSLGDSYAAGTGAGDYEPGTEGTCWRSANSSAAVNVAALRADGVRVEFTAVGCSGATIADLSRPFEGEPPQLDALRADTDAVQLTVGAGDIGFATYGGLCLLADCAGAPTEAVLARVPAMSAKLVGLLSEIRVRSPHAAIVLAGYGRQLSPGPNAPGVVHDPICADGVATPAERTDGNRVARALDAGLREAAATARAHGVRVTYVSPYRGDGTLERLFVGASLCEAGEPFYRGLAALAPGQEGEDAVLHLNRSGQAALAKLIRPRVL